MPFTMPKIEGLLGIITIRLSEDNFVKWSYQFQSVLQGYDLYEHFDGSSVCPSKFVISETDGVIDEYTEEYKQWLQVDKALLSLLIATLSDDAIEYVVGCKSAREAWLNLSDRYASVSRARVTQLKTELHTITKGADSVEKFLLRLKHLRDQLAAARVKLTDDDIIIAALNGLPADYDMIKMVIYAHDAPLTLKDFCAQLLSVERNIESRILALSHQMNGLMAASSYEHGSSSHSEYSTDRVSTSTVGAVTAQSTPSFHGFNGVKQSGAHGSSSSGSYRPHFQNPSHGPSQLSHAPGKGFGPRVPIGPGYSPQFSSHSSGFKSHVILECQICNKRGHTASTCYHRIPESGSSVPSIIECQICGKKGHSALDCYHHTNFAYHGSAPPSNLHAMNAQATTFSGDDLWIADGGSSHHMTHNLSNMTNIAPYNSGDTITIGNGAGQGHKDSTIQGKES